MINESDDQVRLNTIYSILSFAESLPIELVSKANTEPVYPVTVGERITSYVLDQVLQSEWRDERGDHIIGEIEEILNQLDIGVDKPHEWHNLFLANKALGKHLHSHTR